MSKYFVVPVVLTALVLGGCGLVPGQSTSPTSPAATETVSDAKASIAAETKTPSPSSTPIGARTVVQWSDYDPGTQAQIDLFTNSKDCRGLQTYVGMATATEVSVKAKSGHGAEALMKYITESLTLAGCS